MNNILITGATGFVGSNLTKNLLDQGHDVHVLVRKKELNWRLKDNKHELKVYECDLLNPSLSDILNKIRPEYIFHCASYGTLENEQDSNSIIDSNIKGTLNLLEAIKHVSFKLFVNTGSSSEYGIKEKPMKEDMILEPNNMYGISKAAATFICQQIARREKLPIITLRLFSPYGYFEHKNKLIPSAILQSLVSNEIMLSSPTHVRDFIFIEDVMSAYTACINRSFAPGEIFNIGSGKQYTVGKIIKTVLQITNSYSKPKWGEIPQQARQQEPSVWRADISKAKNVLQWKPQFSLYDGLKKTIEWFKINKNLYD